MHLSAKLQNPRDRVRDIDFIQGVWGFVHGATAALMTTTMLLLLLLMMID